MKIQINMNQKKKTTIAHNTLPNVHSYASIQTPPVKPAFGRWRSVPEDRRGCIRGEPKGGNG
jgi:hypothetical protein